MLSKIAVFKKKIEIDDEQNRLGPSNKVILPQHNSLYFNTNIIKVLSTEQKLDSDSSLSDYETHSFRSKIAKNEAAMNNNQTPRLNHQRLQKNGNDAVGNDAEKLMRQKSMAPVKDWASTVTRRIQNNKYGVETTKKHYEREAVAKYIFNKFGVHLLTFNHQTRNEMIPLFGEHIRLTNATVFKEDKNDL